jgi:hypothetical protein
MKTTTVLISFYSGNGLDANGRTLSEILSWDDNRLETVHDYIQWLFPLTEPSQFNPDAPLLTVEDIQAFASDPKLRAELRKSFVRMLKFYGFTISSVRGKVIIGSVPVVFRRQAGRWLDSHNHNLLRITRILKCLTILGLSNEAKVLLAVLKDVRKEYPGTIGNTTFRFWNEAVRR